MTKVSLIIPIYNVEKYLAECLKSVTEQTYQDLEVMLVNDGSSDQSGWIAREFAAQDPRFVVLDKENGGQSDARNFGIEHCQGEYIVFMDSDDVISPYYIENLAGAVAETGLKLAMCKMTRQRSELESQAASKFDKISGNFVQRAQALGINQDHKPNDAPWDKIYQRSLFDEIRYPKGQIFEDSSVIFPLLDLAGDYTIVDSLDYFYRPNDASTTGQQQIQTKNFDLFIKNQTQIDFLTEKHPEALDFGLSNVLNANDYWAQIAVKDKSALSGKFFDQLWQQNKAFSRHLGLRRIIYSRRGVYRLLMLIISRVYSHRFLRNLLKSFLMRN
ncbi:glycosyltransferase family 2 protein [Lactovum odontotermitis]